MPLSFVALALVMVMAVACGFGFGNYIFLVTIFFEMATTFLMRMRMRDMQYAVRCWVKVKSRNAKLSYGARRLRLCVMYHAP